MNRRRFLEGSTLAVVSGAVARADVPDHLWSGYDFGPAPPVRDRLNQGPFGIEQDQGWYTVFTTTPAVDRVRNYGLGLVGYTWEEGGPSLAAREGKETVEQHVEKLSSLPFVDLLYMRCDWRDVQREAGKLHLNPVWKLTMDAAREKGLRVGFRIQLSSPNFQPAQLALPDFLRDRIPLVNIGALKNRRDNNKVEYVEPRYDAPEFQRAFRELNELLAAEFDGNPLVEFMDLMMYGFWGEGHTGGLPNPFPDYVTAERTFVKMTELQLQTWKRTPLAVNTQPDISRTGNREVHDLCVRAGCWLRSDSIILDEPIQIEMLANRPPWLAVIMEDGYFRAHRSDPEHLDPDTAGIPYLDRAALHALDLGANYWALWTEADNMARYYQKYPDALGRLRRRLGYRVRPSWIWQRKRHGAVELVMAFSNDGVAGVPGVLRVTVENQAGSFRTSGCLDAGHPHAGRLRQASFVLPRELFGQKIRILGGLETKAGIIRPINWACAQPLSEDRALSFQLMTEDDPRWRKGV